MAELRVVRAIEDLRSKPFRGVFPKLTTSAIDTLEMKEIDP